MDQVQTISILRGAMQVDDLHMPSTEIFTGKRLMTISKAYFLKVHEELKGIFLRVTEIKYKKQSLPWKSYVAYSSDYTTEI